MKNFFCIFLLIATCFLSGCFNYNDIDKVTFATSIIVDTNSNKNAIIYVEAFKSEKSGGTSSGTGKKITFKSSGKTLFEALRNMNMSAGNKINFSQVKIIIFTQKAAESGLYDFVDFFGRDQEFMIRSNIAILRGDPEKFIKLNLNENKYIGLFIYDLIHNIPASSRAVITTLNDFLNKIYTKQSTAVITMLEQKKDQPEPKIEVINGAVIKKGKMVDIIDGQYGEEYNFLIDNIKGGSLEVTNPCSTNNFITLEIIKSKTKTKTYYENNRIFVKKIITVKTTIAGAQNCIDLNDTAREKIEQYAQKNIANACNRIFKTYKSKNLDIFNIDEDFERKYPKINMENPIKKSTLQVDVDVNLEGSSTKTNFRE